MPGIIDVLHIDIYLDAYRHRHIFKILPEVSYQLFHIQGTNSIDLSARISNIFPY